MSLLEVLSRIAELDGTRPVVEFGDWRPGDQRYYVSDVRAFGQATGWRPRVTPQAGIALLHDWLAEVHSGVARRRAAPELV